MSSRPQPSHPEVFAAARSLLAAAAAAREAVIAFWNDLERDDVFEAWLDTTDDGRGELRAGSFLPKQAAATLSRQAAAFLTNVKGAMDAAVLAAGQSVCTPLWPIDPEAHRMPLAGTPAEFDALVPNGQLLGLRPDQVRTLREFQPFTGGSPAGEFISLPMSHLMAALGALERGERLVCAWATHTGPEVRLPDGATLASLETASDGPLTSPRLLTTIRVDPPEAIGQVDVLPNVALDLILNVPPWPANMDDNFQARSRNLLIAARHLIEGMERSVSTPTFIQQYGRIDDLAPSMSLALWKPVLFDSAEQETDVREGLAQSDLNLASIRGDDCTYTLVRLDGEAVVGREIPEASQPEPTMALGPGTELVALEGRRRVGPPGLRVPRQASRQGVRPSRARRRHDPLRTARPLDSGQSARWRHRRRRQGVELASEEGRRRTSASSRHHPSEAVGPDPGPDQPARAGDPRAQ
jgi:hypothetical protein